MKYDKDLYVDNGIYAFKEKGMKCRIEKIIKCRNPHKCASCGKEISQGEQSIVEIGFLEGERICCYTCLTCIEEWLEKSGQINNEYTV